MFKKFVCTIALLMLISVSTVFGADIASVKAVLPTGTDAMIIENTSDSMEVDVSKQFKAGATLCIYSYIESSNSLELLSDDVVVGVNGKVKLQTKGGFSVISETPITGSLIKANIPAQATDNTVIAKTSDDFFFEVAVGGGAVILAIGALIVIKQHA